MAGREKKIAVGRKQSTSSPVPSKESTPEASKLTVVKTESNQSEDVSTKPTKAAATKSGIKSVSVKNASALSKKITKTVGRKAIGKALTLNIKAREKKNVKIKQQIAKTLLNNAKNNLEGKKAALLQNGVKPKRVRRKKIEIEMERRRLEEARLANLENVVSDPSVEKKIVKKRIKKVPAGDNTKKAKVETTNDYSSVDETINSILSQIVAEEDAKIAKKQKLKKPKMDTAEESIEDVVKDLTYLLKADEIKQEEDLKTETVRAKRPSTRKPKSDVAKKRVVKKESQANQLDEITLDASAKHLIDMLDLSVDKANQLLLPTSPRRHSIEKCSVDIKNTVDGVGNLRAPTPRSKRTLKVRQSVDAKLTNARSDIVPVLRNGKNRKNSLSNSTESRKRKRLGSDLSGSEKSVSKLSGYESDSSFNDVASGDKMDQKDEQFKLDSADNSQRNSGPKTEVDSSLNGYEEDNIKKEDVTDSNSNVCSDMKTEVPEESLYILNNEEIRHYNGGVSSKVPEKSIILNKMKQTFNDVISEDQDKQTVNVPNKPPDSASVQVTTSTFYGHLTNKSDIICDNTEKTEDQTLEDENIKSDDDNTVEQIAADCASIIASLEEEEEDCIDASQKVDVGAPLNKDENVENLTLKGDILQALGLQSLKEAEEAKKEKPSKSDYTGTLKTVIKLNRGEKKKGRGSFKLTLQKHKGKAKENEPNGTGADDEQKNKEITGSSWRSYGVQSSDTADGSSEHTSDGDGANIDGEDVGKILVIPEKASSFSIHPDRLCKDECSYCFGKFGLFDTPCHIAQMKSIERQDKILQTEKHLMRDSCLCDACYRHVDRKSNTPSYLNKGSKRNSIVAPGPRQNHCHVLGCGIVATNILRRKWLIKMRKSVREVINIDLENPGLHSIPICSEHYLAVEHLMVCAMCKRKLARNHVHYLGSELTELSAALCEEGIPVKLIDRPVVCKLCRYFASLVMKPIEERSENTIEFFTEYKKRLLNVYDVEKGEEVIEEQEADRVKDKVEKEPAKRKKRLPKTLLNGEPSRLEQDIHTETNTKTSADSKSSRSESPSDYMVDYHTLIPSIAMDCGSDVENSKRETTISPTTKYTLKTDSNVNERTHPSPIKAKSNSHGKNTAVERLGCNPCISVRQLFPGEEELGLQGYIEFGNVKEKTPEGWEKCCSIIQYDNDTKLLWQELQKPYGNQSSFLRHLVLLEKYFRSGDLVLSPTASHHSINYSESVQNRLRAYDNVPHNISYVQTVKKSNPNIISPKQLSLINAANIPKNTPITISQLTNIAPTKTRIPPGLISLHPGTTRPVAPSLMKVPQSQKIKIPITKNWRPNLIPIDPSKSSDVDKKPGFVKVMSGGKPYHITMDDYNRMCAIKKSYDLKQKRLAHNASPHFRPILPRKSIPSTKATSPSKNDLETPEMENNLDKLDKTVENLESKLAESSSMLLPKIPKSLTVIPQTVSNKLWNPKPKSSTNS
ncbi:hypothetical protein PPYR_06957 [Photinus pyralis]|uniref:Uncharacterized protein n=2 Tax=Photinus pyralis TaxID=7054 RepID=A0A5N4AP22_PHOPY|nr:uncharacterized protein LOC116167658 isoform X2 [Photinus pyralis]KAB0799077.1 hypothetical protein PPYR_06957 [Photinus pyralis]